MLTSVVKVIIFFRFISNFYKVAIQKLKKRN